MRIEPGRLRRRTVFAAGGAAALGALLRPGRAIAAPGWYEQAFQSVVAADPNIRAHLTPGQEFWYRPRQLLVAPADLGRVMARLTNLGYVVATGAPFAGVARVMFRVDVDIKAIVDDLRNRANWAASVPVVQPHHVVVGYPNIMGNPGDAPASLAVSVAPATGSTGSGQLVGICDTGIWADATKRHPLWFAGSYAAAPADIDELYQGNSTLALQAGHGTFIAGVLRRTAPSIMFDPAVALTPHGIGDEASVAAALASLNPTVSYVNLSLGCYTMGNVPSLPLANAIASLAPTPSVAPVVVAAAGNAGSARPTWPAALPGVVAVAALRTDALLGQVPTEYSNFGPWVDLCAIGGHQGPYVTGLLAPPDQKPLSFDGFATWHGTSFAVPYAIGRMAKLVTNLGISPQAAAASLCVGPKPYAGYGAIVP
ncbi:S8 family serine peptidase [Micromonospora ureilytica]|uniref:Peptidase S8/S53 domain-containing protein n=1 Tax=Micromonospora ureilytica TaxID=709868 RepID=A0ABS0JFC4_9ACTN|nr:S8 family serine peptidase [Micromonospora ureilytica]MBG6065018.1 hypothetical protein [Micromonospora ureilytica]